MKLGNLKQKNFKVQQQRYQKIRYYNTNNQFRSLIRINKNSTETNQKLSMNKI